MAERKTIIFHEVLDIVESLPENQQEDIIDIISHRLTERRRESLAKNIKKTKKEYAQGKTKKGTVSDLMKELSK